MIKVEKIYVKGEVGVGKERAGTANAYIDIEDHSFLVALDGEEVKIRVHPGSAGVEVIKVGEKPILAYLDDDGDQVLEVGHTRMVYGHDRCMGHVLVEEDGSIVSVLYVLEGCE